MKTILGLIVIIFLISCKNNYNEMIEWADGIPIGTSIDSVQTIQPRFIKINWVAPDINKGEKRYFITNINESYDPLKMTNYLSFINNKFQGRFAHK